MSYSRGTGLVLVLNGSQNFLSISRCHGFPKAFWLQHTHHITPRVLCILGKGGAEWVLVGFYEIFPLFRSALFPAQPPFYAGCRLYEKGTLPGATFIYEALILTMATSVRWREETPTQSRDSCPSLGGSRRQGQEGGCSLYHRAVARDCSL